MNQRSFLVSLLVFLACITGGVASAQEHRAFPARQLLKAIDQLDNEHDSSPVAVYFEYRRQHPEIPAVEWDPFAAPYSAKSWLLLNLDNAIMERLRLNQDEKGNPLL